MSEVTSCMFVKRDFPNQVAANNRIAVITHTDHVILQNTVIARIIVDYAFSEAEREYSWDAVHLPQPMNITLIFIRVFDLLAQYDDEAQVYYSEYFSLIMR